MDELDDLLNAEDDAPPPASTSAPDDEHEGLEKSGKPV